MERHKKILVLIFLIALAFRLYFAFQTPNFNYDAYYDIRQINEVSETGKPIFNDELSYGGRTLIFSPLFYYIMAFFNLIIPYSFKIIPNIFASCLVFVVFLIARKLTKDVNISLLTAFISAFIPIFIFRTINNVSVYSLVFPLIFLMLYLIMNIEKRQLILWFIFIAFLVSLIHPISFLLVIGLLFYTLIMRLENLKENKAELELILLTIFLVIWVQFLIFKNAFLTHGLSIIWSNLPQELRHLDFGKVNIVQAILYIGLIPITGGIYTIYKYLFKDKNREIYLLTSFAIAISILLWFKLIQLTNGLAFLGIIAVLLTAKYLEETVEFIKKTKVSRLTPFFIIFIVLIFITSIVPSYYFIKQAIEDSPSDAEITALKWIDENTPINSTVVGTLKEGSIINAIAKRKNVVDNNFLLIQNPSQRLKDVERIYLTQYETEATDLLNKYSVDYILFSENAKKEYNIQQIKYTEHEKCFELIYNKDIKIFSSKCELEKIK
jgi:4-amino-4-deoxy-L-arabinose transferase-like glycosyltransferase